MFWKSRLKMDVRKTDVEFFKLQLWTGSVILGSMAWGCCQNPVQYCTILNLRSHSRVNFMAAKLLKKPIFLIGGGYSWWYEVQSIDISSATTTTTKMTTKTTESLWTERITLEGTTGKGTGDRVEDEELPTPSPRRRAQRSRETGIIGRDGQELCPREEGGIRPCGSGGGRLPTMVRRPHARDWRTGPQTPYATTPGVGPFSKFGSPGTLGADDG